jgi:hypothetical protein
VNEIDRRAFLKRLGIAAGAATGALSLAGCSPSSSKPSLSSTRRPRSRRPSATRKGGVHVDADGLPVADWLVEENARPGTTDWLVHGPPPNGLEGFCDTTSAVAGDEVTLYVNSMAPVVKVKAYRLGWYQGKGARLVADLGERPGRVQPAPKFTPGVNMVECDWQPTMRFGVGDDWPPGYYLIRLGSSKGWSQWVPLVVRDDRSRAAIAVKSSVNTWQAYNLWGGYSLYLGPAPGGGQSMEYRSRVVSFNRPYPPGSEDGSSDLFGNEYPFVALVERLGLDVTYFTDVDLHETPQRLGGHSCLVSLGHDEYWSATMREACQSALASGLNLMFLGANACYRHIRYEDSSAPAGRDRHQVCYKDAVEDPLYGKDNAAVTANWPSGPDPRPESQFIGIEYQAYQPYNVGFQDLVVVDPSSWILEGTGLRAGSRIPSTNGSEFDRYVPGPPSPDNVQIICHSPITSVLGPSTSDMSYYTHPGGGGVFASGTASFVNRLWANPAILPQPFAPGPIPNVTAPLTRITTNLLAEFSKGPLASRKPSVPNWQHFYSPGSSAPPPVDVGGSVS